MNSILSKLEDKYGFGGAVGVGPKSESLEVDPPEDVAAALGDVLVKENSLHYWRDSEPVYLLSCFLKEYKAHGFHLRLNQSGEPVIQFNPGLKSKEKDPERFDLAEHALYLRDQAREDLKRLVEMGSLVIQKGEF